MHTIDWAVDAREAGPVPGFPQLRRISQERVATTAYRWAGQDRAGEDHCLLKLTLAGCGAIDDRHGSHRVAPGQALLCRVGDPAITYWWPAADEAWQFVYLVFDGAIATDLFDGWTARHGSVAELPLDDPVVARVLTWRTRDQLTLDSGYGLALLGDVFRSLARAQARHAQPVADRVQRCLELMREHLAANWSVEQFASRVGVTREQLTRDCDQILGEAPYRIYRRLRVEAAARAVATGDAPLQVIAETYGWASAAHFSRVFRQLTGVSPSQCRRTGALPVVG